MHKNSYGRWQKVNNIYAAAKGQLISKGPFGVIVPTRKPTKFFLKISALGSKKRSIKKIKALYIGLFNIIIYIFFDLNSFLEARARVETITPKSPFEIN